VGRSRFDWGKMMEACSRHFLVLAPSTLPPMLTAIEMGEGGGAADGTVGDGDGFKAAGEGVGSVGAEVEHYDLFVPEGELHGESHHAADWRVHSCSRSHSHNLGVNYCCNTLLEWRREGGALEEGETRSW
jgi:hypothetical protein